VPSGRVTCRRRLAKEREAEDHLFGDKDKFVTAAYKKKLQEDQKWLAEERVREAAEKRDSVVARGHRGDFYRRARARRRGGCAVLRRAGAGAAAERAAAALCACLVRLLARGWHAGRARFPKCASAVRSVREPHLRGMRRNVLTNNAAFGTSQAKQPAPAADAAEAAAAPQDSAWEAARRARAAYEAQAAAQQGEPDPAGAASAAGDAAAAPAEQRDSADPAAAAADGREGQAGEAAGEDKRAGRASGAAEAGSRTEAAAGAEAGKQDEGAEAALPAEAPVDKAAKAASARERYLARKRKVPG
jgi:hypothetical protein